MTDGKHSTGAGFNKMPKSHANKNSFKNNDLKNAIAEAEIIRQKIDVALQYPALCE
ncbi:hypothetical protein GCM10011430_22390 [Oxalicibacterium solurbis]|uniref:Uncharacterized protein n=1 Tax=Oxalicibacterium solurbis TaxID=69280 RepID=A0A8J3B4U0_9BURK|nr:hypothetical protein GCM10011430_22390 [Oxalicibacterium solurbis]